MENKSTCHQICLLIFVGMLTAFWNSSSFAGEGPDFIGDKDQAVITNMKFARDHITGAHLLDGSNVRPETAEELKNPVIPIEEGKRVVNRGILTALAKYCGLDGQNDSYLPFMSHERQSKLWSDKQLAYIGLLHGITQAEFYDLFKKKGNCSDLQKQRVQTFLDNIDK
ncbi:MAG TPA: hypothetical protein VL625_03800 [Patescibacteria group bacterium]|nr:hypothetical protein [Patescibacteria group bacterium]